jgi:myo-inositol-1(or 4)-monophosphatase
MENSKKYLNLGILAAKSGGIILTQHFGRAGKAKQKNHDPKNLVTSYDLKIEKKIRSTILKQYPTAKIIGEEYGACNIETKEPIWIIDPIDGTTNFIHGIPYCCISIAVWQNNQPQVAVIYNPILNQLFTAISGQGAYLNGKKILVSKTPNLKMAFGSYGWGHDLAKISTEIFNILPMLNKIRSFGSTALEICMVATGQFDFKLQGMTELWDIAAASLIVTEAGGTVTDWQGNKLSANVKQILATNKKIHNPILKILKK